MIDGRFDQHFLEIFAHSPDRGTDAANVPRMFAVTIVLIAAILAGWVSPKSRPDEAIRADQVSASNVDRDSWR